MTDLGSLTDQDLVNEWAKLVLPTAGGVQPGQGSFGGRLDMGKLKAVIEELERRGYSEQPGGYFESKNPGVPRLRPEVS
jgi:hypothetical protein